MNTMNTKTAMCLLLIYTLICGVQDLRTRQIRTGSSFLFAGLGLLLSLILRRSPAEIGQALLPGMAFLALSRITKGIGAGDAVYLLVCAAYTDMERLLWMIICSLLISAAGALYIILKGNCLCRNVKHVTLPYLTFMIPALLGSFLVYRKIILPLIKPAIATGAILVFQNVWNNIETSNLFTTSEGVRTLSFYINTLSTAGTVQGQGMAAAAALIMFIPNLILFIICQGSVMNTMATSGIK